MHGVPESGYEPNYNHRQQFLTTTTTTTTTTTPRPPSPPSPPLPRQYPAQVINIHGCTQFDKKNAKGSRHVLHLLSVQCPKEPRSFQAVFVLHFCRAAQEAW